MAFTSSLKKQKNHACYLARLSGGYSIHGAYNATHGKCIDAMEYFLNKNHYTTLPKNE
ncbi:MAG: hypothetical protein Tsb0021_18450 [Chlamydiales bacterium]